MTGRRPRPQPWSEGLYPLQPPSATQASHSSKVTANRPTAKGFPILTECCGPSTDVCSSSLVGDPIVKVPEGTTTISGHCSHSLKLSPRFKPHSSAPDSGRAAREV